MLEHKWFKMEDDYACKMNEMEYKLHELREQTQLLDNYGVDLNYILEEKANLMCQNQGQRHPAGTFRDIYHLKQVKSRDCGLLNYRFPGELIEDDLDKNGGDVEDNVSQKHMTDFADKDWMDDSDSDMNSS